MTSKKLVSVATTLLSTVLIAGCGGDSSSTANGVTLAEGVYEGTISNGNIHNTLVLENDQFYTLYGTALAGGGLTVKGFIEGKGKSDNGNFSASDIKDFRADGSVGAGTLSAAYVQNASFSGVLTEGSSSLTFTGTAPLHNSLYSYNTAANLSDIVGAWSLTDTQGVAVTLSIASNSTFSGVTDDCSFTGTLAPRASGKNVFDIAITFGASPCILAGQTTHAIGIDYLLSNGKRQLIMSGTDTTRAIGAVYFGTR